MRSTILLSAMVLCGMGLSGCATTQTGQDGSVIGGLLGATAGAIIGHQTGDAGEGALIGAGLGAITGGIIGDSQERSRYTTTEEIVYRPAPVVVHEVRTVRTVRTVPTRRVAGHYEIRLVRGATGETYEERVWVYD